MKKTILSILIIGASICNINAQISEGGMPRSFQGNMTFNHNTVNIPAEQHEINLQKIQDKEGLGPYIISSIVPTSINYNDGSIIRNSDGTYSWYITIYMPNSKGIGFYMEDFYLPHGVKMYIYNSNKKHVLGAYTSQINNESKIIVTEPVQGSTAHIELNIDNEALLSQITFHINKVASYFRGFEELEYYSDDYLDYETLDIYDNSLFGRGSKCMINAFCPQAESFENQRNASLQVISIFNGNMGGLCSASMINGLGNTNGTCEKFLLTASHCGNNSTEVQVYDEWLIRFNYQQNTCNRTNFIPLSKTTSGATFLARSDYDAAKPAYLMKGDFLLLKITSLIPASWNVVLSGWNSNTSIPTTYIGSQKFIGFHHPGGDIKKLSVGRTIISTNVGALGSHWWAEYTEGYGAKGTSGSGYFNNNGHLIGVASLAPSDAPDSCKINSKGTDASSTATGVWYSKLSYCWDNVGDGVDAPNTKKLRPWLDPAGTGTRIVNAASSSCVPLSLIGPVNTGIKGDFAIFPNPATNDIVQLKFSLENASDLNVTVYDIQGRVVKQATFVGVSSEIINLNIEGLTNGMYLIQCSNDYGYLNKRLVINK